LLAAVPAFALFLYLESHLIVIECPSCGKDINTDTPWLCGYKNCRNEDGVRFPFIYECKHCHYPPKAYVCHHCERVVYLTSDKQLEHAASRLESPKIPAPVAVAKDPAKDKAARHAEDLRDAEHELKMARYKKDIEIVKNKPTTPPQVRSENQSIIDRVRKGVEGGKTLIDLEGQLLDEARAAYPDDDDKLQEMEKAIREAIFREKDRLSGGF